MKRELPRETVAYTPEPPAKRVKLEEVKEEVVDVDSSDSEAQDPKPRTKRETNRLIASGKTLAARYGLDFQTVWFPAHNHRPRKGDWATFLITLASSSKVSTVLEKLVCPLCSGVIRDCEGLTGVEDLEIGTMENDMTGQMSRAATARLHELKRQEGLENLPMGRRKRLLPTQVVPLHHDLLTWLATKRPGRYCLEDCGHLKLKCLLCDWASNGSKVLLPVMS